MKWVRNMRAKEEIKKLVEDNIGLVDFMLYKHFKPFINLYPHLVDDLKQEGSIGLMKAAEKFDETKGSFTTIATFNIKNAMLRFYQRYVKRHYNNKNITIISADVNVTDDEKITLLDSIISEHSEKDYRVDSIMTRTEYSEIKDINLILNMTAQGYSQEEIAKVIGTNQVQVSRRLNKFKQEYTAITKLCETIHKIKAS
ncbi:MAG TPA: sigma-70 family RNA polymerase sigma factor [Clostridium perfringens]|nr:sigma-70 family RNA polymerase sigma factor [Clostridium perfringens]